MTQRTRFLVWWIGGVMIFAVVIALHLPLTLTSVPGGMGDHQAAGDAATVNAIHAAWAAEGLLDTAKLAMVSDLIFIGIYGTGSVLGGLYFRSVGTGLVRHLGTGVTVCGALFLLTDYGETIAQAVQLFRNMGSDSLAGFAATMRPVKNIVFLGSFAGVIAAFAIKRIQRV